MFNFIVESTPLETSGIDFCSCTWTILQVKTLFV